jgi:multidrug efflux pump subunit AcrA (membrane-fusion protein)
MFAENNFEFLKPVKSDDLLPQISRWAIFGGVGLLGCCGGCVLLASLLKYPVTVKAAAVVRPQGELRIVEARMAGAISEILVRENQQVAKGDAIAKIDTINLYARKNQAILNIEGLESELGYIDAQIASTKQQIQAEKDAIQRAVAQAEAELENTSRQYNDNKSIAQAEVLEAGAFLELAAEEAERYQRLENMGAVSKLQISEKLQAYKAAQARQKRTKVALNPTLAPIKIAKQRIAQEKARGDSTIAALNKERDNLIVRQVQLQNQIRSNREQVKQILSDIEKSVIRAPEDGAILQLQLRNSSQMVTVGQNIAQIAPKDVPLVIKARIPSQDISKVKTCQLQKIQDCQDGRVSLRVSAYPYPDYGTLKGVVREITADTKPSTGTTSINNQINNQNASYYEVTIVPEDIKLEKNGIKYPIKVGMEVTADIIAKQETLMTFILRKARLLTDI